ncbi:Mitochondrial-processing peptidase subunit alpha like protein [Verticillium longisporum]|uniref:Alpha-MPP n=1 Tax=Verticillium longisporum TaxID=100787 RepID=A0A8I3APQ6_VERLO|nr:Mitochondrial-processing peptidase subunit alpha like protein [Verticillium longisporum]
MLRSIAPRLPQRTRALVTKPAFALPSLARSARTHATVIDPIPREPTDLDNITTLPNGLRIASEALPGSFSGVGVYVDAGSRYESSSLRGVSHIMDRLAFKSTSKRSADEMIEQVEALGGNIQCASSREAMMYQAATFNAAVPTTIALLAETIRDPLLTEEEVQEQLGTAAYEIKEIWSKPDLILPELVHTAAFKDNTLGNPLLCPEEQLPYINGSTIRAYRDAFYRPERMVVAFAGVEHSEAVQLATQYFGDMVSSDKPAAAFTRSGSETSEASTDSSWSALSTSSSPAQKPSSLLSKVPFFKNLSTSAPSQAAVAADASSTDIFRPSHYTGGFMALPPQPPSLNPAAPNFTHIHLAFEGLPISSDDIYALATLQTLLGGGGSFSAGGPGKGMYSHLRRLRALTLEPGHASSALRSVEVQRAKNQLRSSLLMNLESRMVELEDLGRQVQVHGRKVPVGDMCRKIEALTVDDLRRVAKLVVGGMAENPGRGSGAPTVVLQEAQAHGVSTHSLTWESIQNTVYGWQLGRR